jgi:hypothetical protein
MRFPSSSILKLSHRTQLYHFGFGRGSAGDYIQDPVIFMALASLAVWI